MFDYYRARRNQAEIGELAEREMIHALWDAGGIPAFSRQLNEP